MHQWRATHASSSSSAYAFRFPTSSLPPDVHPQYTSKQDAEDVQYATFLLMARAGVRALEFYDPATGKHGQAHMQARLGITQHLLASGIARLEKVRDAHGTLVDAFVRVDRAKVLGEGRAAVGKLLVDLQVRKSTADGAGAREFYTNLTRPIPDFDAELRELVLRKKQVRLCVRVGRGARALTATRSGSRARSSCSRTRSSRAARSCSASTRSRPRARSRASSSGECECECCAPRGAHSIKGP
jgi:hypothetical protein